MSHDRRICLLPDGITAHGPVVRMDQGVERLVGYVRHGKREGRWFDASPGFEQEMFFKAGKLDGRYTVRDAKHTLLEWNFRDGHSHGKRTEWQFDGTLKSIEYFNRGRPTGTWERHEGDTIERRTYSDEGRVIALDGSAVPEPPAEISLADGSTLTWSDCMRLTEAFEWDGFHVDRMPKCREQFERVQTEQLTK
jgi:hypothetical protein